MVISMPCQVLIGILYMHFLMCVYLRKVSIQIKVKKKYKEKKFCMQVLKPG
jgi:hypothetical protein